MNSNSQSGFDAKEKVLEVAREQLIREIEARGGKVVGVVGPEELAAARGKLEPETMRGGWSATAVLDVAYAVREGITREQANLSEKLLDTRAAVGRLIEAAEQVISAWESGDLAGAVRELDAAVTNAKEGI